MAMFYNAENTVVSYRPENMVVFASLTGKILFQVAMKIKSLCPMAILNPSNHLKRL